MEKKKVALLYAPPQGRTEKVARMLCDKVGEDKIELILITKNADSEILKPFDKFIFGISTVGRDSWDANYSQVGWDYFLSTIDAFDFKGKTVAIYGLGDHLLYSNNFVDAMGALAKTVIKNGANLVGKCSPDGYTFNDSEALVDGLFLGLPIDEDNEEELTDQRLSDWISVISKNFGF